MLKKVLYGLFPQLKESDIWSQLRLKYRCILSWFHINNIIKKETALVRGYYSKNNPKLQLEGKTVIAMVCDGWCTTTCGLTDRLRGIVYIYYCVKALNDQGIDVKFKIHFVTPFQLSTCLEPNSFDWRIGSNDISYNSTQAEPISLGVTAINGLSIPGSKICMYKLKHLIKRSKCNQIHIGTNATMDYDKVRYIQCFNELFKLSPLVCSELDKYTQRLRRGYVSATFRFQNLLGDFYEGEKYLPLDDEVQKEELIVSCMQQVEKVHNENKNEQVLVTSDSKTFLNRIKTLPYVFIIDGDLVHMGHSKDQTIQYKKSFVDYFMISKAKKVYLLRTGKMYRSGFPYSASLIHNKPYEFIQF